jgi:apolipoprotein N-acyltransferase
MNLKRFNWSIVWLILGCISVLFMGGKWNILIATWIGSIFFLRYFRAQGVRGFLLSVPFLLLASHVFFIGLAEQVDLQFKILIAVSYTLYLLIPCIIDRLFYHRIKNQVLSTLLYPAALVTMQFLLSYVEQLGTVLHWTGGLFAMKPLLQLVSITGVWGPSFLVGWLASVVNTLWQAHFDLKKVKAPVAAFCAVFVAVMLYGGVRMRFFPPNPGTVKVGSVVTGLPEDNLFYMYLDLPEEDQLKQKEQYRQQTFAVQDELFETSEELANAGVKIMAWPSGNAVVFAEDYDAYIEKLRAFADQHDLYFFPSLLVLGDYQGDDRNRVLAIDPGGEILYTHFKGRNPNKGFYEGNVIETIDTPYGRIASPICFEMEFHRYIRQVGQNDVDILIVPGDEPSKGNAIFHTELSMLRAVENGCSMLRTTLEGLTMGADYQGRVLSRMNFYTVLRDRAVITQLPVHGTRTIYARFGDWFAYGCILLTLCLMSSGFVRGIRQINALKRLHRLYIGKHDGFSM